MNIRIMRKETYWNIVHAFFGNLLVDIPLVILFFSFIGCSTIQKGQDPLVVEAERIITVGQGSMELVTTVDEANRNFWKTNAPAFHQFVESLREKVIFNETNIMRRGPAILNTLNTIKLEYKASKINSNALITAIATAQSVLNQAQLWLAQVNTNSAPR